MPPPSSNRKNGVYNSVVLRYVKLFNTYTVGKLRTDNNDYYCTVLAFKRSKVSMFYLF